MSNIMKPDELRRHIKNFIRQPLWFPGNLHERYTVQARCNTFWARIWKYILSAGSKFQYIGHNPNVCLRVNTDYINYTRIEECRCLAGPSPANRNPNCFRKLWSSARTCMPWVTERFHKGHQIIPDEIVYLNSRETGDRTKQILTSGQIVRHKAQSAGELAFR